MQTKQASLRAVLLPCILSVVLVYTVFFPAFYAVASFDRALQAAQGALPGVLNLALAVLRLVAIVFAGVFLRKKSEAALHACGARRRTACAVIACLLFVSLVLMLSNVTSYFYAMAGGWMGIDSGATPLFFFLVWEQFARGYLLPSIFLCMAIVFFRTPPADTAN